MSMDNVPRCQHVKVNGTQCGSPALRRRRHCFFHDRMLDGKRRFAHDQQVKPRPLFSMGLLEDANSVQVALMQVLQLLGSGQMDPRIAGLMLYGLQTASVNLRRTNFEASRATDVVIDRNTVAQTSIDGPQWFEEDFEDEAEEEDEAEGEMEDEAEGEEAIVAAQADAAAGGENAPKVKHVTVEEARKQVQGVIREWLLETVGEKPGASPG